MLHQRSKVIVALRHPLPQICSAPGQTRPRSGRFWPNSGQLRSKAAHTWPIPERVWPICVRLKAVQTWRMPSHIHLPELGAFGPNSVELNPKLADSGPTLVDAGPILVNIRRSRSNTGRNRANSGRFQATFVRHWLDSAPHRPQIGRTQPDLCRLRTNNGRCRCRSCPNFGQMLPMPQLLSNVARIPPTSTPLRPMFGRSRPTLGEFHRIWPHAGKHRHAFR